MFAQSPGVVTANLAREGAWRVTAAKSSVSSVAVAGDEGGRNGRQGESLGFQEDAVETCPACVDELPHLTASGIDLPLTIPFPRLLAAPCSLHGPPSPLSFSNASAGLRTGGVCMNDSPPPSEWEPLEEDGETCDTQLSRAGASASAPWVPYNKSTIGNHRAHKLRCLIIEIAVPSTDVE